MTEVRDAEPVDSGLNNTSAATRDSNIADSARRHSLNSPIREKAIHPFISEIKMPVQAQAGAESGSNIDAKPKPGSALDLPPATNLHPITLQPFTMDDLRTHNIESLLRQYTSPEAAGKARDDTAKELRKLLDENQRKTKEIDREVEEKEKTREMERKVYARKLGKDG